MASVPGRLGLAGGLYCGGGFGENCFIFLRFYLFIIIIIAVNGLKCIQTVIMALISD